MKPTRPSVLIAIALVSGVAAFLVMRAAYSSIPTLQAYAPASLAVLGVAELMLASTTRARLAGRPGTRPIHPITVARIAALAKASSPVGALGAGVYAGLLIYVARHLGQASAYRRDTLVSALAVAASLLLIAGALLLERVCRVRRPPGEDTDDTVG